MSELSGSGGRGRERKPVLLAALALFVVCLGTLVLVGAVAAETGEAPDCEEISFTENADGQFEIENLSQLQCIEDIEDGPGLDQDYVLVDDIDASETEHWNDGDGFEPIGECDFVSASDTDDDLMEICDGDGFSGTFDANGHTISNLSVDRADEDDVGLFGGVTGGSIADVRLENVTASGSLSVGGLFGAIDRGTITDSHVSGDVHGSSAAGGLGGSVFNDSALDNVSADGTVEAEDWNAGGLAAYVTGGDVRDSFASATVHAGDRGGGLLGLTTDNVTSSYATGDVIVDGTRAGGLVGATAISHHEEWGGDISNSYATGNVTGADRVGGLIGYSGANVTQSYATGNVSGDDDLGGLIGYTLSAGTTENAYWDRGTTNQPEALGYDEGESDGLAGFGETADTDPADEMTGLNATENMASFEFPDGDGTWHVVEDDYPVLAWQDTDPFFGVNITETTSPVDEGDTLDVTANVTNLGGDGEQSLTLTDTDFSNEQQDFETVALDSGDAAESTLEWDTTVSDAGTGDVTVDSGNDTDSKEVTVELSVDSVNATIDGESDPTVTTGEAVTVSVSVENPNGDPIEDEEISIDAIDTGGEDVTVDGLSESDTAMTDSDGNATFGDVTFSGVIDGTVEVTLSAEDDTEDVLTATVGGFAAGDGTEANPYEIADWHHLDTVRENLDANVTLSNDLDEETDGYGGDGEDGVVLDASDELVDGDGFKPIGECGFEMFAADPEFICEEDSFTGTFDGDGKTISDLTIDRPDEADVGLFGGVTGGTIENVTLENATVVGNDVVGTLAGGFETALVSETHLSGTVDATASFAYVGGLVGMGGDSEIYNSSANTTVNTDGTFAGGLAGIINSTTVHESFATGDVNGEDAEAVGGLLGSMFVGNNVTASYATGDVTGYDGAGGLVSDIGSNTRSGGTLSNSYATGNVSGEDDIGGLVGIIFEGEVSTAYATGTVSGDTNVGGLVGDIDPRDFGRGSIDDSYWDYEQSPGLEPGDGIGSGDGNVTGLATAEMTGLNATEYMDGLAFGGAWHVTDSYPALAWEDTTPFFEVTVAETSAAMTDGTTLVVNATVTNWGETGTQTVTLTDTGFDDQLQDSAGVTLDAGAFTTLDLEWETDADDVGTGTVTVASDNDTATMTVSVHSASIAEPTTIEAPGTYELVDDITHDETVIEIVADDVVLDGNGHALASDDPDGEAHGIHVDGAENVTVENVTVADTDGWGVVLTDGASATVDRLDVGDSVAPNTTLSFDGTDVRVDAAADPPEPPEEKLGVDRYFAAENTSPAGELAGLELAYEDTDLSENIDESSLALWKDDEGWQTVEDSGVDTDERVVTATVTEFSTFGAFGDEMRFADGDGSAENPYEIETWEHLHNVRFELEANFTVVTGLDKETAGYDEYVGGEDGFDPIGELDDEFNGSFDGGGHTIESLTIDREDENYVGLFGVVGSVSTLENVSLVDVNVTGHTTVGGLVGENRGDLRNVSVTGTVSGASGFVGGLAGFHDLGGEILDVSAGVDVDGEDRVGGLVGESWGEITAATATGDVEGDGKVGGLVGESWGEITAVTATGDVHGVGNVGGLVGEHRDSTISRSTATGDVSGAEDVGGMVGQNRGGTITDSAATGDVDGGDLGTGGLVGWNDGAVSDSFATGAVDGDEFVGGLVGENSGTVTTSYVTGVVDESESADAAGGLVGENSGDVDSSYWDIETTGQTESGGSSDESGLATHEMTGVNATASMDGFDFPATWHVTGEYPALAWQDTVPFFGVAVTETNSPVAAGETLTVTASVTNWADDGLQTITLTDTDFTAAQQDATDVTLETGQSATVELDWTTDANDGGTGEVTVASESHAVTESVTVEVEDEEQDPDPDPDPVTGPDPDPEEVPDSDSDPDPGEGEEFRIEKVHESHDEFQQLRVDVVNSPPHQGFDLRLADPNVTVEPHHSFDLRVTRGNETVDVSDAGSALTNVTLDVGDVRVENLTFRGVDGGDLSLVANASSEPLADTPDGEFPEPGMVGLAYLDVTTTFDAEDVTFTFRVEADALAELASAPETVVLHQYNETTGLWDTRETTLIEEDKETETLVYETTADSFSAWAVGAERPVLELADAEVDATTVVAGESVTVEAAVQNSGSLDGEADLDLRLDGEAVDSQQVDVAPGESRQVAFTYTFADVGEYTLAVGDVVVADVTVEAEEGEPDDSPADDGHDEEDEPVDVDDDGAGLGMGAALLAFLVVAAVTLRSRR